MMFRLFSNEMLLEVFKENSLQDQARLAQVDRRFNGISKNKSSELEKYKSKCTVHSSGHTHVVLQEAFEIRPQAFFFYVMKGGKKAFNYKDHAFVFESNESYNNFIMTMKGDTLSLIEKLNSFAGETHRQIALLLQESLGEENRTNLRI